MYPEAGIVIIDLVNMMNDIIKNKIATLPDLPGSYQMIDETGKIIYVGKAKNLKNRVKSYFVGSHDQKTQSLVSNVVDFTYIVTNSELEAFLLELSLIKEHSPRFNIMLMDDKTYPYIEITNETYPKIIITRKPSKKALLQYGPFPDAFSARETVHLLDRIFPLRKCAKLPKKVCLYYHLGQCLGPCEYPVPSEKTQEIVNEIKQFMSGMNKQVITQLKEKMMIHSEKMEYEKAKEFKDLLDSIDKTLQKQQIIFSDLKNRDVFHYYAYDEYMAITTLYMRQGKITFSDSKMFSIFSDPEDAFLEFLAQFYEHKPLPQEILVPSGFDYSMVETILEGKVFVPQRGDKVKLLQTAEENARIYFQNNINGFLNQFAKTIGALDELATLLKLPSMKRIESFDNSNTFGQNPVSAMVVFTNGLPDRKEYRKYIVKSVTKADDYNTMKEVLYRRYQRMLMEKTAVPDLIIMDGGVIQVHAAKEILSSLFIDIPVIGLRKDDKHKTDALINLSEEVIQLDRRSNLYVFLTKIQDEVHRFAITFHRNKQKDAIFASILDAIPKVGKATKEKLLMKFKSIDRIKNATSEELKELGLTSIQIENLQIAFLKGK